MYDIHLDNLKAQLARQEAVRPLLYDDMTGRPFNKGMKLVGNLTGGVGHNFGVPMRPAVIDFILGDDVAEATRQLVAFFPWVERLDPVRRAVLLNMTFNMGVAKLATFHRTLETMQTPDYYRASVEMLESAWAEQVGTRATELAVQWKTGEWL